MKFRIRILSPWATETKIGDFHFSPAFSNAEADALVCDWAPNEELLTFPRAKAWYCCEATSAALFRTPEWRFFRKRLEPSEFLYHAHPDPRFRVPHITQVSSEKFIPSQDSKPRINKAIAIVSNSGATPWRRSPDLALRNKFITHPAVDLFGRRDAWQNFRATLFSRARLPQNYRGEIDGGRYWTDPARYELMSRYKVMVCFENTCEPYYFTEKFVGAVQAGCIPIYHAHETVNNGVLKGAMWVDPVSFGFNVRAYP